MPLTVAKASENITIVLGICEWSREVGLTVAKIIKHVSISETAIDESKVNKTLQEVSFIVEIGATEI